jgi:hypothetical protein
MRFQPGHCRKVSTGPKIGPQVSTTNASVDVQGKAAVYNLAPFSTFEAALGIAKDGWSVQAYGENLSDTRAQLYADYYNFVETLTTNRPRTSDYA